MVGRRHWFRRSLSAMRETRFQLAGLRTSSEGRVRGSTPGRIGSRRPRMRSSLPARTGAGKRILFINQYYWPDHASTAQHLTDLAESMAGRGYECHVLCAQGRYQPGEPNPPAFEIHEGVRIHRVPATSLGRRGTLAPDDGLPELLRRGRDQGHAAPAVRRGRDAHDAADHRADRHAPEMDQGVAHAYWSMDLHPDASLALGRMSPSHPVVRLLDWLSGFVYRQADRVVVLGPYMADRIALKRVDPDRIATIPVWSRRDEIYPIPRATNAMRKSLGLDDAFVAMYSGNLGLAHSFEEFLAAARAPRSSGHRLPVRRRRVRDWPRSRRCRSARAWRTSASSITCRRSHLHVSLSMADVHLISMRPEMTGIVVPGSSTASWRRAGRRSSSGREHCESADTIRFAGCGVTVAPRRRRGPGRRDHAPGRRPQPVPTDGRAGPIGLPGGLRAEPLLQPLVQPARRAGPEPTRTEFT